MTDRISNQRSCPACGKKIKKAKAKFCPSCGRELFTPRIGKNWNLKVIAIILLMIILAFFAFYIFKPFIYFNLDKV